MILVSGKKYKAVLRAKEKKEEIISELKEVIENLQKQNLNLLVCKNDAEEKSNKQLSECVAKNQKKIEEMTIDYELKIEDLRKKLKQANSSRGGLQASVSKLRAEIKELKESSRLKVKKIKSCRGTTQKMRTSKHQRGSVRNFLKELNICTEE